MSGFGLTGFRGRSVAAQTQAPVEGSENSVNGRRDG